MSNPVFMSLGSQYDFWTSLEILKPSRNSANRERLKNLLEEKFAGKAILTYKGRDAIQILLKSLKNKDRKVVFMQGFACFALEEAIHQAGFTPGFVDIETNSVNLSLEQIQKAQQKYGLPAAVILQHTFGVPAEMAPIRDWCKQNKVALIDDLAQSFGALDEDRQFLGTKADGVICSFGRDKVIDAVTGGAAIMINPEYFDFSVGSKINFQKSKKWVQFADSIYPFLTVVIRGTFNLQLGKLIHSLAKKTGVMKSPLFSHYNYLSEIPENLAGLALKNLQNLDQLAAHRKKIANIYFVELSKSKMENLKIMITADEIARGANLRFPLWVDDPAKIAKHLAASNVYISDRWYRQVIDCSSIKCDSSYQIGICPNAEELTLSAIQLPTHQLVNEKTAHKITKIIKEYYV